MIKKRISFLSLVLCMAEKLRRHRAPSRVWDLFGELKVATEPVYES